MGAMRPVKIGAKYSCDDTKRQHMVYTIDLENQHRGLPPLSGTFTMNIVFEIVPVGRLLKKNLLYGRPVHNGSSLISLVRYVEELLIGTILPAPHSICSIQAQKIYGPEPITTITLEKI